MFTTYVPIGRLINSYGINHYKYADDTQAYTALVKPPENDLQRLESCTAGLQHWFWENDLLLNSDKSEVCFFGTGQQLSRTPLPSTVTVAGYLITMSDKPKTRCVTLDAVLTFENYVNNVAKACNFHMWGLRHIRRSISRDVANAMAACIVGIRLNCWNALLYGATEKSLNKLQIVQNKLARVVCNVTSRQQLIIDLLRNLQLLLIRSRITFKVATLCNKAYQLHQPSYLLDTQEPYVPCRGLRSAEIDLLAVPRSRNKTASRHFSSAAPTVWNGLPLSIRNTDSIVTCKSHLKTHTYSILTF